MNKMIKSTGIRMVLAVSMAFLPVFFLSCFSSRSKNGMAKVKFVFNLPIVKTDGEVMNVRDSVFVFNQGNTVVLKIGLTNIMFDNDSLVSTERKWNYFAYEKGKTTGLFYDPDSTGNIALGVDSMLKSKVFGGSILFVFTAYRLLDSKKLKEDRVVIERYVPIVKRDESYPDSVSLFYSSRYRDVDFSLSKFMDSLLDLKLYKISTRYNRGPYPGVPVSVPEREILFELKVVSNLESSEMSDIFEKFRKDKIAILQGKAHPL